MEKKNENFRVGRILSSCNRGNFKVFQNDLKTEESEREITFERNLFARHGSKFDHQQTWQKEIRDERKRSCNNTFYDD